MSVFTIMLLFYFGRENLSVKKKKRNLILKACFVYFPLQCKKFAFVVEIIFYTLEVQSCHFYNKKFKTTGKKSEGFQ